MVKDFFRDVPKNFLNVFRGRNLIWHFFAIAGTVALVISGVDWQFYEHTRYDFFYTVIIMAGLGGFLIPVLVPIGMYLVGVWRGSKQLELIAIAAAQAELIAYLVSATYKIFTGRTQPEFLTHLSNVDISPAFHFGILQNGIFWGWPSSHTAVAFAGATALAFMVRSTSIRIVAFLYAIFIAVGASIGFHWLSDVFAGAILGILVGTIVAKNFEPAIHPAATNVKIGP